jgi:undecaprenyl diphosphate synthase
VWRQIERAVEATKDNTRITLNVAINYGGRAEIIDAVRKVMRTGVLPEEVREEMFSRHFYVPDLPDLDLVIRTGGENRLSNFMLWHAATALYYSTPTYWPDFDEHGLQLAIEAYQRNLSQYGEVEIIGQVDDEEAWQPA